MGTLRTGLVDSVGSEAITGLILWNRVPVN